MPSKLLEKKRTVEKSLSKEPDRPVEAFGASDYTADKIQKLEGADRVRQCRRYTSRGACERPPRPRVSESYRRCNRWRRRLPPDGLVLLKVTFPLCVSSPKYYWAFKFPPPP